MIVRMQRLDDKEQQLDDEVDEIDKEFKALFQPETEQPSKNIVAKQYERQEFATVAEEALQSEEVDEEFDIQSRPEDSEDERDR